MPAWLAPSLVAALIVLVAVPRLRAHALATAPGEVAGRRSAPPAAGAALMFGVLGGLLFESYLGNGGAVLFVVGALLGGLGLLDAGSSEHRRRLGLVCGAGVIAVALGARVPETGSEPLDVVLTLAWILFVTNGFTLLSHFDGLAAGVAAVACLGVFAVGILAEQPVLSTAAIATGAACVAFLVYNRPPAWVRMGAAGSLFLGFTLAILTLSIDVGGAAAEDLLLPVMLLGLPVALTATATVARVRQALARRERPRRRPRLDTRALSEGQAVFALVAAEVGMVTLAVILARRMVPAFVPALLGAGVIGAVRASGIGVRVSGHEAPDRRRSVASALLLLGLGVAVLSVPAVLALLRVEAPARAAQATAKRATAALDGGDASAAVAEFERAAEQFAVAKRRISGPLPQLSLLVPVLSANVSAAKALVSIGEELSRAGSVVGKLADPSSLPIVNGAVVLEDVHALIPALTATSGVIERSQRRLEGIQPAFLAPPLAQAVDDVSELLEDNENVLRLGAETAQLLPSLLGEKQPKRYFIAFQNNSELRGTGGFVGNWGELVADAGELRLERFGRLNDLQLALRENGPASLPLNLQRRWDKFAINRQWQQVNVSPDFPTTAQVIDIMYAQSGGQPIDGVIAIDPVGLAALLGLTGPVSVPSWPEPITSANVVDVTLVEAYERYPIEQDAQRVAFLGDVARAVTEAFTRLHVGSARQLVTSLGSAVRGRHLMVYTKDHRSQELIRDIGADGGVPVLEGDSLFLVNQNMAGNKIDTYLRREVRYEVELVPRGGTASVSGRAEVALTNAVPSLALPESVVGPYLPQFRKGESRSYVSLYSPFLTGAVSIDGERAEPESHFELGRPSQSVLLSIDAGQTRTVAFTVRGEAELGDRSWYRLDLVRQPTLNADTYDVAVAVPSGWRIADVRGASATGSERRATMHLETEESETLWVKVEPTGMNRVWDRLLA